MFISIFEDRTGGKCFYPARDFAISISARRTRCLLMRVKARFKLIPSLLLTKSRNLEWGAALHSEIREGCLIPLKEIRDVNFENTSELKQARCWNPAHTFFIFFGFARKTSQPFHRASPGAYQNQPVSAWAYNQHAYRYYMDLLTPPEKLNLQWFHIIYQYLILNSTGFNFL